MDRIDRIRLPRTAAPTVVMATREGLAVIDMIAVERAVTGQRHGARLTRDEAHYAASLLVDAGYVRKVVGPMVGVDPRTIAAWFPEQTASVRSEPVTCGTTRGYRAHKSRGDAICRRCRAANAAADLHYRKTGTKVGAPAVAA
ncbi:hypothetical protein [Streptomyces sp. NPDC094049]|uniref:hypothetical protein n=1 Tax=Streptomyces sp. NPDC094049 TaxID=3154987 RepID=UPI00331FB7E3